MELVCPDCGAVNRVPAERLQQQPKCGKCGAEVLPARPIDLTATNFDKFITRNELPVLVDFWAPWCGPCRMLGPVIEEMANDYAGKVKVCKLNTDEAQDTAAKYNISAIPTILIFKGGKVVNELVGMQKKEELKKILDVLGA